MKFLPEGMEMDLMTTLSSTSVKSVTSPVMSIIIKSELAEKISLTTINETTGKVWIETMSAGIWLIFSISSKAVAHFISVYLCVNNALLNYFKRFVRRIFARKQFFKNFFFFFNNIV